MRRGFKADAERRAEAARISLGLASEDKLNPWVYASSLDACVLGASELDLPAQYAEQLFIRDPDSWSGMTLSKNGKILIVLNNYQTIKRQASTLSHEIAHHLLNHIPSSCHISSSGLFLISDYSEEQEEEADWLGGALLLPQVALMHHRSLGKSIQQIANEFGVSDDLCHWRSRMTGVEKRLSFRVRK